MAGRYVKVSLNLDVILPVTDDEVVTLQPQLLDTDEAYEADADLNTELYDRALKQAFNDDTSIIFADADTELMPEGWEKP